ncbi:MAG TPA: metallophosphoesterase [Bacilli bacterium]|nr:metallophosphoesterase [Bacilli bacterium]
MAGGYLAWGTWAVEVKEYRVPSKGRDSFTIVQISDLHGKTRFFNGRVHQMVNALQPDLICVTGDLTNHRGQLPQVMAELAQLRARHGVFFVPGNYEREEVVRLRKRAITGENYLAHVKGELVVLENAFRRVRIGETDVFVYGFDNSTYGRERYTARGQERDGEFRLYLAHSPNIVHYLRGLGVTPNLLLVGHTHGGQIRLFNRTFGAYSYFHVGLRKAGEAFYFAINKGLGTVKVPFRIDCRPEISVYRVRGNSEG